MKNPSRALWASHSITEQIDWDSVYKSEFPRIYNFFLYRIEDRESVQDLTATTFERAWKSRFRYRVEFASLSAWLFGIARNIFKEHLRQNKMRGGIAEPLYRSEDELGNIDIEKSIQQEQTKDLVRKAIRSLPERDQDLIALKYGAGLTNREIAKITKLSESNVGSILHRSVKNLRNRLDLNDV